MHQNNQSLTLVPDADSARHEGGEGAAAELEALCATVRQAAGTLAGLSSVYTLGPGNAQRVIGLLYADVAKVAGELRDAADLALSITEASTERTVKVVAKAFAEEPLRVL